MRTKNNMQDDPIPAWQTIYCSLVLIMLVLFVMLASYSSADKGKITDVRGNFRADRSEAAKGNKVLTSGLRTGETFWANEAVQLLNNAALASNFKKEDLAVEKTRRGFICKFKSDILFNHGEVVVNKKLYPFLDEIIRLAEKEGLFLNISGYTDDSPVRSDIFSSNWEISALRASNVLRYFSEKGKIPMEHLAAAGFGQYHPLVSNDTPLGRKLNRRIEVTAEKVVDLGTER